MNASIDRWIFGASIFLGAFLLFLLQPIIGKHILPWFGSSASLWSACLMFFQLSLLAGYLYAHGLHQLPLRRQAPIHIAVLTASLVLLLLQSTRWGSPLTPSVAWAPGTGEHPIGHLLQILAVTVGLPFFLLAANSTLLQAWYVGLRREACPYAFYAVSNAGSLLGLLLYPFLLERLMPTPAQGWVWGSGYLLFTLATLLLARRIRQAASPSSPPSSAPLDPTPAPPPTLGKQALWVALAACASILLVSTSNLLCQDVAPVPLLWILPLALYLLTFVIGFSSVSDRLHTTFPALGAAGILAALWIMQSGDGAGIFTQLAAYLLALFLVALFCHATLYTTRPPAAYLTRFYLLVATGGAAGGAFVNLVAPVFFQGFWEYPLALLLTGLLLALLLFRRPDTWLYDIRWTGLLLPLAALWIAGLELRAERDGIVHASRNFYGLLRVKTEVRGTPETPVARNSLLHGSINHGFQYNRTRYRYQATAYFSETAGIGRAILSHPAYTNAAPFRMGVVGLGIGTLAAYGRAGDRFRFYELDPHVADLARDPRYFTYLADSPATQEIILGDGRLALQRELDASGSHAFDVLALDAFSGDAIPTHLLTREAFALYLQHLAPQGILAVNGTNRHIDLTPLGVALAREFDLSLRILLHQGDGRVTLDSKWLLFSPAPDALDRPYLTRAPQLDPAATPPVKLWTDQYSHLISLLHNDTYAPTPRGS